jgi:large subunit ribosomal protein L9
VKLILREHVDHLGERGKLVEVADGYARNYLLPKGLAVLATPGNQKQLEHQRRVWVARDAHEVSDAEALAARIAGLVLGVRRKAGESGTLYGSVTNADVAEALLVHGIRVDRRKLVLPVPIKTIGEHEVGLRLHPRVLAKVRVQVEAEPHEGRSE